VCRAALRGEITFGRNVDSFAKDIIQKLLHREPHLRLGTDFEEMKKHQFFRFVNWKQIEDKTFEPPAGFTNICAP